MPCDTKTYPPGKPSRKGNIKTRVALGRLYLMSDPVAAEAVFERVARDAPNKPHSYYYLGFAQQLNGKALAAAASFRRCLGIDAKLIECDRLLRWVENRTMPEKTKSED